MRNLKKTLTLLLILVGIVESSNSQTIRLRYGTIPVTYEKVNIYKNGVRIDYKSSSSDGNAEFDLETGSYSYRTETNFSGEITNAQSITLNHKKLTFTLTDEQNNPLSSETIDIFEDGDEVTSASTNSSGIVEFYLKPSNKYAYRIGEFENSIDLTSDVNIDLNFSLGVNELYMKTVVAKYKNYPIDDYLTICNYSDKSTISTSYTNSYDGTATFTNRKGKYWIKNKLNIYSEIEINETPDIVYLEYKKVRFISNPNNPNILDNIKVSNTGSYYISKTTDGMGYADFYLLPGNYKYSHLANSGTFTVTDDTTINISTSQVIILLKNASSGESYGNKTFSIGQGNGYNTYETDENGEYILNLIEGEYVFTLDKKNSYPFQVTLNDTTVTPPIYNFNLNIDGESSEINDMPTFSLYNEQKDYISFSNYANTNIPLLQGTYYYTSTISSNLFQLDENVEITKSFYDVSIKVSDKSQNSISGTSIYLRKDGDNIEYLTTNNLGEATATMLSPGEYTLYNPNTQEVWDVTISNSNKDVTITIPDKVHFIVNKNGESYTGYISLSNSEGYVYVDVKNGIGETRLNEGDIYSLSNSVLQSEITIETENKIELVSVNIKTEGKGLAFPYSSANSIDYTYLKGDVITLTAIPVQGWTCKMWKINNSEIEDAMVDYTITEKSTATAIFNADTNTSTKSINSSISNLCLYPNPASTYICTNDDFSSNAIIYNMQGNIVRTFYVSGSKINISSLSPGQYILVIESKDNTYRGAFVKE